MLPSSRPPAEAGQPAAAPAAPSGGGAQQPGGGDVYVVQPGDTISVIAGKVGMKTADLKALNGMQNDTIRPGQKLKTR
jgi:LysM repeat protein